MQANRGCEKDAPIPVWTDKDGVNHKRCPRRPILENVRWFNTIINAYNAYKNGFLPHEGGMQWQAAKFASIMTIVDATVHDCDEQLREIEQRRANVNASGTVSLLKKKGK